MPVELEDKITKLKGIGAKQEELYNNLGINTIRDLLYHIPFRYDDATSIKSIEEVKESGDGSILAEVTKVSTAYFRKPITTVSVQDDTGTMRIVFFNQAYLQKTFKEGDIYIFAIKISISKKNGKKNIYCSKYEKYADGLEQKSFGKILGIYPETEGITSKKIRAELDIIKEDIPRLIKDPIEDIEDYITETEAIEKVHYPQNPEDIKLAQKRLSFDEILPIAVKMEKDSIKRKQEKSIPIPIKASVINKFIKSLPYQITDDQNTAISQILEDCSKTTTCNRLLNGDVGSGKTVVSATVILNCIKNGFSAILLAPTTVLAKQHYDTFSELFKDFEVDIELCISSNKIISDADNKLIIGTHAILYKQNLPADLNLVVIDEQHRFGVDQRNKFKVDGKYYPHYLTMTATPIPRSLTEIFFGNLDVCEIRQKPKGRKEIQTFYVPLEKRYSCFDWVRDRIINSDKQEQAFFIYPIIDESDRSSIKSVLQEQKKLKEMYPELSIEYIHGKLKDKEKECLLKDFRDKKINILISTTVIEVGIDIPDATIMVIEDAEMFGLAQLHQLRGRVGRSDKESFCYVLPGDSVEKGSPAEDRLKYFAKHSSGFDVASYDLQTRGPGEVYGTKQSGIPNFKVAKITDTELLSKTREYARKLLDSNMDVDYILDNLFR